MDDYYFARKKLLKTAYPKVESQLSIIIESVGALAFDSSRIFFRGKMTNITCKQTIIYTTNKGRKGVNEQVIDQ